MSSSARSLQLWRAVALIGASFVAIGIGTMFLDELSRFRFDVDYDYIGLVALFGTVATFSGCIGWARHLGRSGCASMGWLVFAVPGVLLFFAYLVDGLNVHGSAGLVFLSAIPTTILAIALWIMAAMKPRRRSIEKGARIEGGTDPAPPVES
jgi:hypothetical protein